MIPHERTVSSKPSYINVITPRSDPKSEYEVHYDYIDIYIKDLNMSI